MNKHHLFLIAMYNYALMMDKGENENKKEVCIYYKIAAANGDDNSMLNYALILNNADGVPVNHITTSKYFKMAANKGCQEAMAHYLAIFAAESDSRPNENEISGYLKRIKY